MDRSNLPPAVVDALRRGNKIEAIKLLREAMGGLGLAEVKAFVDRLERGGAAAPAPKATVKPAMRSAHPAPAAPRRDGLSPGEEPRSSSNPIPLIGLIALAGLALWLFSRYG